MANDSGAISQQRASHSERELERVLWDWNVQALSYTEKLKAAETGGFTVLSVPYRNFQPMLDGGTSPGRVREMAAASGVRLDFLDGFCAWYPSRYQSSPVLRQALDFTSAQAIELCAALNVRHILAIGAFDSDSMPEMAALVEGFGEFCAVAAQYDIRVELEPMAMLGLATTAQVWEILRGAGCTNSGLIFDTWHFERGGADYETLSSLPRGTIRHVQFSDGPRERGGDIWSDAADRRLPGEGSLPLVESLSVVAASQDIETVGPEALSQELTGLSPVELGQRASVTTETLMRKLGWS